MPLLSTIGTAAEKIRDGQLLPSQLVEKCLQKIEQHEQTIHAWVVVDAAGARRQAVRRDKEAIAGRLLGPLHGIPIGIKDIVDVAEFPTEAGSPLRKGQIARHDAPVVAQLREAGAIILGKTVTTQFACFDPPPTVNPRNQRHTPGGSSSGSAAAVASGMCMGAIGSQTGGSITRPATYCGIAGLKPTFGKVSTTGLVPVSRRLDHVGPLAPCVRDLSFLWDAMRVRPPGTTIELPASRYYAESFYQDTYLGEPAHRPHVGVIEQFFMDEADATVQKATVSAMERLLGAGIEASLVTLPGSFDAVHQMHRRIMVYEAAKVHGAIYRSNRSKFAPGIASLIEEGLSLSDEAFREACEHQRSFSREMGTALVGLDALVMPATSSTAPPRLDTTGDPKFNAPWSYAGLPVVSIPCGIAADGMPSGLQFVAAKDAEESLLFVAGWAESVLMGWTG